MIAPSRGRSVRRPHNASAEYHQLPGMNMKSSSRGVWADILAYRRAYLATCIASFGGMLFGWDTGLIGGVLTMDAFQHSFNLDPQSKHFSNLQGNIVSVLQGGCFFGALSSFYISGRFGRRPALLIADVIFLIGSIIQTASGLGTTSLTQLYIGRFIGGFGVGLISAVVPTYIGETVNKEIRGRCIGCMQLWNVTGIMLAYFVNYGMTIHTPGLSSTKWRVPFALQMLPGAFLLLLVTQHETPRWLVEESRVGDALQALAHVRGKPPDDPAVQQELDEIIADFRGKEQLTLWEQMKAARENKRILYQSTFGVVLMFWQQWTGTNSINYYSPQIFKSIGLSGPTAGLFATGIYGVVKVVFTALALAFMTEQVGRKWSLILGALGQAFAMFYIGINLAIRPSVQDAALTGSGIFAIICIYLFVVFYSFGWGPIPFVLASECSPNHVRSLTVAGALMTQWLFNFVIAKLTPIMLASIKYGTFLLFGACCILMCVYAIVCIPETKGVPLESIHELFEGNILEGALQDNWPATSRAKEFRQRRKGPREILNEGESPRDV